MNTQWDRPGRVVSAASAPEATATLGALDATRIDGMAGLAALARVTCARTLALEPLPAAGGPAHSPAARDFAEQFSLDVSAVSDDQRNALATELGGIADEYVLAVYAADWVPRVRRSLDALCGIRSDWTPPAADAPSLWPVIDEFLAAVARMPLLDPVLTELVRLRGARSHNCRMCRSLRSSAAMAAGADEGVFDALDDYPHADFSPRERTALAFTDALIWQPGYLSTPVLDDVRAHFSPEEAVELTLDVARNAVNKVPVSLGRDEAVIEDGRQSYTVDADGRIEYGDALP